MVKKRTIFWSEFLPLYFPEFVCNLQKLSSFKRHYFLQNLFSRFPIFVGSKFCNPVQLKPRTLILIISKCIFSKILFYKNLSFTIPYIQYPNLRKIKNERENLLKNLYIRSLNSFQSRTTAQGIMPEA